MREVAQLAPLPKADASLGIFVVGFAVFLLVALAAQLVGFRWRTWLPGAEDHKSLVGGVTAAVYTFMSYLT
jgi:light-harvesting complex 1 beta chain